MHLYIIVEAIFFLTQSQFLLCEWYFTAIIIELKISVISCYSHILFHLCLFILWIFRSYLVDFWNSKTLFYQTNSIHEFFFSSIHNNKNWFFKQIFKWIVNYFFYLFNKTTWRLVSSFINIHYSSFQWNSHVHIHTYA